MCKSQKCSKLLLAESSHAWNGALSVRTAEPQPFHLLQADETPTLWLAVARAFCRFRPSGEEMASHSCELPSTTLIKWTFAQSDQSWFHCMHLNTLFDQEVVRKLVSFVSACIKMRILIPILWSYRDKTYHILKYVFHLWNIILVYI